MNRCGTRPAIQPLDRRPRTRWPAVWLFDLTRRRNRHRRRRFRPVAARRIFYGEASTPVDNIPLRRRLGVQ